MAEPSLLVVDDDRLVLATLVQGLTSNGYAATPAASGEEALELLDTREFDLALVDHRMPGMSGLQLADHLRERDVPFLTLTAYSDAEVVESMIELGALCYLVKPVDIAQLVPAVETALSRAREIRKLRENEHHLQNALHGDRGISTAVGILMERYNLKGEEAFERLRGSARSQRRKLAEVAREVVMATDSINAFNPCETPQDA